MAPSGLPRSISQSETASLSERDSSCYGPPDWSSAGRLPACSISSKMANPRREQLLLQNCTRLQPQNILSLGEHVTHVTDDDEATRSRKKSKKSKRKHRDESDERPKQKRRLVHSLSDSGNSAQFEGFDGNASVYSRMPKRRQLPAWLNESSPPGPWQASQQSSWPFSFGTNAHSTTRATTPMPDTDEEADDFPVDFQVTAHDDHDEPTTGSQMAFPSEQVPSHEAMHSNRSLEEFMNILGADQDVAPNVWPNVATLVEKTWNVPHKEEIKVLYTNHKRPGNTPSLQKVTLDNEIASGLAERFPAAKRNDSALSLVGNALVKTAVCITDILNTSMTQLSAEEAAKKTMTNAFDALRILSYANAQLHGTRRNLLKYVLDPNLRQPLCREASLESINNTHQLFGGEMQKKAKEGWFRLP